MHISQRILDKWIPAIMESLDLDVLAKDAISKIKIRGIEIFFVYAVRGDSLRVLGMAYSLEAAREIKRKKKDKIIKLNLGNLIKLLLKIADDVIVEVE